MCKDKHWEARKSTGTEHTHTGTALPSCGTLVVHCSFLVHTRATCMLWYEKVVACMCMFREVRTRRITCTAKAKHHNGHLEAARRNWKLIYAAQGTRKRRERGCTRAQSGTPRPSTRGAHAYTVCICSAYYTQTRTAHTHITAVTSLHTYSHHVKHMSSHVFHQEICEYSHSSRHFGQDKIMPKFKDLLNLHSHHSTHSHHCTRITAFTSPACCLERVISCADSCAHVHNERSYQSGGKDNSSWRRSVLLAVQKFVGV
jgi:hypothetical protein